MMPSSNWIDRTIGYVAPRYALKRARARAATVTLARHYEAASHGRRTSGWSRPQGDANAVIGPALSMIRSTARDLVRNNGYAESALRTICDHVVGWGITAKPSGSARIQAAWRAWAETKACDSDGRHDLYGLQYLAMRTIVESGEVLIRRRIRLPSEGLPIPMQIQVLDPDYLDTTKDSLSTFSSGGIKTTRTIQGIEYDILGRRTAYWLFREHPGSNLSGGQTSVRIPAESVAHIYRADRPGQGRGVSWFAPVLLKFKDFDDYDDATLMKQKIAACLAVLTTDPDGTAPAFGTADTDQSPEWDALEPGLIMNLPPGRDVHVVDPPSVTDHPSYTETTLRAIATGLGVTYEDLTGDYSKVNFSSARMARIQHWRRVEGWRWRMLIPQMCNQTWAWAMEALQAGESVNAVSAPVSWTAPPLPMVDPDKEGLAAIRNIRGGIQTRPEVIRELGYDPDIMTAEYAEDNKKLDKLKLVLDSDPRNTTQQGNPRQTQAAGNVSTFQEPSEPKPAKTTPAGGAEDGGDPDPEEEA